MQSSTRIIKKAFKFPLFETLSRAFSKQNKSQSGLLIKQTRKMQSPGMTPEQREATINVFNEQMGNMRFSKMQLTDPDSVRVQDIYKQMDSSLEGFFYKRKYDLKNFNFLLQILSEQKKPLEALKVFQKMKDMGIQPNQITYLQLLTTISKSKDAKKAEEIFLEAKNDPKIGIGIQMYNSLIMCYTRRHEPDMAYKILLEMKENGFKPDIVCYTTVINAYKNARNLKKCWELFDQAIMDEFLPPDENLLGLMIEICAGSHDAEKAKRYFKDLVDMDFKQTCLPYNAIIKALGSRKDYAAEAVDFYNQMIGKQIIPDADTYIALFKACGMIGDVKTAYNGLMQMKEQNIPMSVYMYNGLLRTYAGACGIPRCSIEIKEMYIEDAWNLFKQLQTIDNLPMSAQILNSLLMVHAKANMKEKIEGLVLPLYEKYGIKKDEYTYQHLMELYMTKRDLDTVDRLYGIAKKEGIPITYNSMNIYLELAMRIQDTDKIVESLQDFKKAGREPKEALLKKLGFADDMPDRVYLELSEFDRKFGFVSDRVRRHRAKDKYLSM